MQELLQGRIILDDVALWFKRYKVFQSDDHKLVCVLLCVPRAPVVFGAAIFYQVLLCVLCVLFGLNGGTLLI